MIDTNLVVLQGVLEEKPAPIGEDCGEKIYMAMVRVMRASGAADVLPVIMGEYTLARRLSALEAGTKVRVEGELRRYEMHEGAYRARLRVFAKKLDVDPKGDSCNLVQMTCTVCKPGEKRVTAKGREMCYMKGEAHMRNRIAYVPMVAWGRMSDFAAALEAGEKISVQGRLQSREYVKRQQDGSLETRTAYEVSLQRLKLYEDTEVE